MRLSENASHKGILVSVANSNTHGFFPNASKKTLDYPGSVRIANAARRELPKFANIGKDVKAQLVNERHTSWSDSAEVSMRRMNTKISTQSP